MKGTVDVTGQPAFTADEFAQLTYIAGADGAQSLTVVAQATTLPTEPIDQEIGFDTNVAGGSYRMGDLFTSSAPGGQAIIGYQVNLVDGGGKLQVSGLDVLGKTNFTADEFAHLTYIAGTDGTQPHQSLTVSAKTATILTDGTISQVIGFDANSAGDTYQMDSLFTKSAPTGQAIIEYQVTPGDGGGKLQVNGQDVAGQISFTADEFAHLTYTAGTNGAQSLTVAAQTTTLPTDPINQEIGFNAAGDTYRMVHGRGHFGAQSEPRGGRPDRHAPAGPHGQPRRHSRRADPRDRQSGAADHGECHRQPLDQRDERPHRDECPGRLAHGR